MSLGGRRQKTIGALNSARNGEKVELKIGLERSRKVWKELEKIIKRSINRVWVVVDKNRLVH